MQTPIIRYCPSCGEKLDKIKIIDIHAEGFKCANGHFLNLLKDEVYTWQTMGSYLELKSGKEAPEEVLKEWLSNPLLRDHLNDNLAGIIRFILDKRVEKQKAKEPNRHAYCPTCGEKLKDVATDDLYVAILKCKNDHTFVSRGGLRGAGSELKGGILEFDYDEKYFQMSFKSWMEDKHFAEYFPHELRYTLRSFI